MNYRILTDSSCDLPQNLAESLVLSVVRLKVVYEGVEYENYLDWRELEPHTFFQGLRDGSMATTNAVNQAQWQDAMEAILKTGEDVLVMAFSSGLSTTCNTAIMAANDLMEKYPERKIFVVDTLCASLGQGLLVYHTAKKRMEGASIEEARDYAEQNKLHLVHWFTVDDLHFLKRGGRISAATAAVGSLLQIKPVLRVDKEGHLESISKARGRKASIQALAAKVAETGIEPEKQTMFICQGDCQEDAEYLAELLKTKYHVPEIHINYVGPVIGAHSGPGTLAVFYLGTNR